MLNIKSKLDPELEFEKYAPLEQLNMLQKQSPAAFTATIIVLLYILYSVNGLVDTHSLYIWATAISVINIYLLIWLYFVRRTNKKNLITPQKAKHFILIYQFQALFHGLAWGLLPFLLIELTTAEMKFFAYIILCGLAAGAIGTTAMIYRLYLSFMLPLMLPILLTQLFFSDNLNLFGRSTLELLVIFVISLLVLAHTHYDNIKRSIILMLENKRLLRDVTVALKKAEAASDAKSIFLANMSHELRTPLNAIIGYGEIINDDAAEKNLTIISNDANKIIRAGKHLLSLINNVLDLSKIEAGKMQLHIEEIYTLQFLNEIKDSVEPLILKNKNTFFFEVPEATSIIKSDSTKLRQILYNIIGNAAKFTSHGEVIIKTSIVKNRLRIIVSDTGIGMNESQLQEMFLPFTQADISTTKKHGGTGLGMNLTKHLTKLLKIELDVSSLSGKGTSFELNIPLDYHSA